MRGKDKAEGCREGSTSGDAGVPVGAGSSGAWDVDKGRLGRIALALMEKGRWW